MGVPCFEHTSSAEAFKQSYDQRTEEAARSAETVKEAERQTISQKSVASVAAHELTHKMKAEATEHYNAVRDHIVEDVGEEKFQRKLEKKAREYGYSLENEAQRDACEEEVIAELCEDMLSDTSSLERFAERHLEAAKALKDRLVKILNAIKQALGGAEKTNPELSQRTVDKWLDGLDAVLAKVEARQETATTQEVKAEQQVKEKKGETAYTDFNTALKDEVEIAGKDFFGTASSILKSLEEKHTQSERVSLIAEGRRYAGIEDRLFDLLSKLRNGKELSQFDLNALDSLPVEENPKLAEVRNARVNLQTEQSVQEAPLITEAQEVRKEGKKAFPTDPTLDPKNAIRPNTNYASMLQTHRRELNAMKPLVTIDSTAEYSKENSSELNQVLKEFKDSGLVVDRQGVKKVAFNEADVDRIANNYRDALSYMNALIALKSAKAVIKNGIEVGRSHASNYYGIEYDNITYAAPVTINGARADIMANVADFSEYKGGQVYCSQIILDNGETISLGAPPRTDGKKRKKTKDELWLEKYEKQKAKNEQRRQQAEHAVDNIDPLYLDESAWKDGSIYDYDFLVKQNPMQVVEVTDNLPIVTGTNNVDVNAVVESGMKNASEHGRTYKDMCLVKNSYSGREIRVTNAALRHGLGESRNRIITNTKAVERAGEIIKNSIPINGLKNQSNAEATYAMAGIMRDSKRTFIVITTVEKRSNQVSEIATYDLAHAMNARIKNESTAGMSQPQGVTPSTTLKYNIQDFLQLVNSTHKSILSESVLKALGETRPENGTYTNEVMFSLDNAIEETRDLIAVHNVEANNLLKMLKLGGFPAGNEQARLDLLNGATAQKYMFAIDEGMSDIERYNELKDARLSVKDYSGGRQLTEAEVNALETKVKRNARKSIKDLVGKFGVLKQYSNAKANIEFRFTSNGAHESINKQNDRTGDFLAMGKMFAAFDDIVNNAVPIEIHGDKYEGTNRGNSGLKRVYVLASAYYDAGIVPVQLEVKEFEGNQENTLYVAVTAEKIEAGVIEPAPHLDNDATSGTVTSLEYGIADILSNINPSDGDFLKYIPDQFLNDAQKASKQEALEKEKARIDKFGTYALDKDFLRETMNAIDTEALEGKLFSLSTVKNLKGLGVWLKEPSRIFDAIAGDDRELRNALHEIFEKPHSDATGRYASNIQKMQARVEQIALDAGALTVNKKGKKTYHEEVSAAIQNYGEGYHMKDCVVNAWVAAQDAVHVVAKADGNTLIDKELTLKELRRNFGYANGNYIWDKAFSDADSDALNIDTAPYTLEDLKRDFPDSWEKIVKADEQFREMYEEYINDMNAMLEKIYPYAFSERDDTLEKLTAQAEKKENRIKETEEAINERLKRLGAIEAEMASKKKTDTKVYDTLRTRKDKINEAIADLKELKARYQEDLAVIAAKKNYLLDMSKSGESLNRMHKLQYRQDYYHHFQELGQETNLRKLLFGNKQSDISPAIVGRREQSKAKGRWAGFFQQRQGDARTADAVNGMLKYGTLAEYKLAFDPLVAYIRKAEQAVREISDDTNRDDLIRFLNNWGNAMAGKRQSLDRTLGEGGVLKTSLSKVVDWMQGRVIANTLNFNMRSSIVQISNIANAPPL